MKKLLIFLQIAAVTSIILRIADVHESKLITASAFIVWSASILLYLNIKKK